MTRTHARKRRRRAAGPAPEETPEPRARPPTEATKREELRIAWIPTDEGGCGYYRIIDPSREIEGAKLAQCLLAEAEAEVAACDVAVFQRTYSPTVIDLMVRLKRRGVLVVYDIDDAVWTLGPECLSPVYPIFAQANRMEAMVDTMQEADLVTVSTEALAEEVRRWCPHVEVLPNRIRLERWDGVREVQRYGRMGREVVIGFAGSATHERDVRMIMPQLVEIDERYRGRLLWRFLGDPRRIWSWVEALRQNPVEVYQWTNFPDYPAALTAMQLDLGLCPLWPHTFNRHKSAVKAFEYSLAGAAVVASDYGPYSTLRNGEDAWLCDNPAQWRAALRSAVECEAERKERQALLTARARGEFALEGAGGEWVEAFWRHVRRIREQEERWLFHSRKWASPHRPSAVDRIALVERRRP